MDTNTKKIEDFMKEIEGKWVRILPEADILFPNAQRQDHFEFVKTHAAVSGVREV